MKINKFILCLLIIIWSGIEANAQIVLPSVPDTVFSTYYRQKVSLFEALPNRVGQKVFIGDSITDGGEWSSIFEDNLLLNLGISGDVSAGLINRLPKVLKRKPSEIFLMIGINDLAQGISSDSVFKNISLMVNYIHQECPSTRVFVQSILPVNNTFKTFKSHTNKTASIIRLNLLLEENSKKSDYNFINIYETFTDESGKLKIDFTNDGLHLKGAGYAAWKHIIYPYVYGLNFSPALIPKPNRVVPGSGSYPLYLTKTIFYATDSLKNESVLLQKFLAEKGIIASIKAGVGKGEEPFISLINEPKLSKNAEAYYLNVAAQNVTIKGKSAVAIFNGIQTLKQLARDNYFIDCVEINDAPAFHWRGYMVDVGRNYQSIKLLKQQIDVMAAYKLNVFHMHLTEDISWRLALKSYPQLTLPENMERNKGMYYTEKEIKELIAYCNSKHILFVPEIDMPGHSAAFKRAMKVDMQSDSGLIIVENILKEICQTYDIPYIHIGADEVQIKNKNFIPEILAFLKSQNKKVIGWEPGGNFDQSTIRQLWMDDAGLTSGKTKIRYIDSRHLYLNHMDPMESVVTIFNRKLADVDFGNEEAMGATLCLWPDRAVAIETDAISMNSVYPAMLAFAERSWVGKGYKGWVSNLNLNGTDGVSSFKEFESRLIDNKKQYFNKLPFPYQMQSNLTWKLYGPFNNGGVLGKKFKPELELFDSEKDAEDLNTSGGTIILRHWWAPKIKGVLSNPQENTTWYAVQKLWSVEDTVKNFWIGFNNFSRSQATDSPNEGTWDNHHSQIWLNNELILPPNWLHAGNIGDLEFPLSDEGYEYRLPTRLMLKKGWNTILVKAPIGSFKGKNWNNPEKWMFTF